MKKEKEIYSIGDFIISKSATTCKITHRYGAVADRTLVYENNQWTLGDLKISTYGIDQWLRGEKIEISTDKPALDLKKLKKENRIKVGNFSAILEKSSCAIGVVYSIYLTINGKEETMPHFAYSKKEALALVNRYYQKHQR